MREEDLLKFLIFIAEEDAQISTIVNFFVNTLGYELSTVKEIVNYGIDKNIFVMVENDVNFKNLNVLKGDDINKVDWSTSNNINEIFYIDFDNFRRKLFVSHPRIPMEFERFISNSNI